MHKTTYMNAQNKITWLQINNDVNGNPRYVCDFSEFSTKTDMELLQYDERYLKALSRAKELGGKKFHNKQYGGGIVFKSYNIHDLEKRIRALMDKFEETI